MGENIQARELKEQVLELRKRVSGEEHPDTILAMGNLARTYADMGETIRARDLQEQALELRKRVSGEEHPSTIVAMSNLASTYAEMGRNIQARNLKEQVLELRKRILGERHPSTIVAMGSLARTYADMDENHSSQRVTRAGLRATEEGLRRGASLYNTGYCNPASIKCRTKSNIGEVSLALHTKTDSKYFRRETCSVRNIRPTLRHSKKDGSPMC